MKHLLIILPIVVYVLASSIASLDLFPDGFMEYWWFDDVLHVTVFGALALSGAYLAQAYLHRWWVGVTAVTLVAITDELSQLFLAARAFSLQDLLMSLLGISVVAMLYGLLSKKKSS